MTRNEIRDQVNAELQGTYLRPPDSQGPVKQGLSTGSMCLNWRMSGTPFVGYQWGTISEIYGPEGCLDSDTFIHYSLFDKNGRCQNNKGGTIRRLYERFHGIIPSGKGFYGREVSKESSFRVPSIDSEGGIFRNPVADVVFTGRKECFAVRSVSGRELVCTEDHRFFVGGEYVPLSELQEGDTIFIDDKESYRGRRIQTRRKYTYVKYHPSGNKKIVTANDRIGNSKWYRYVRYRISESHVVFEAERNGMTFKEYLRALNTWDRSELDSLWVVPKGYHVHHKDKDPTNNTLCNLELLYGPEHNKNHATDPKDSKARRRIATMDFIESIMPVGVRETYDIKCFYPHNNYIANGFVVHNSGKTTLTLSTIAELQRIEAVTGDELPALFVDAEHSLDTSYAEALGVDLSKVDLLQPDCGEEVEDVAVACVKAGYKLVVIDSVDAMVPRAVIEGKGEDSHIGLHGRLMSETLRKLSGPVGKGGAVVLFTNQIRSNIGVMFGSPETTPGGKALRFYAVYRVELRAPRKNARERKVLGDAEEVGTLVNFHIVKNKRFPPHKKGQFPVVYGEGIDREEDAVLYAESAGLLPDLDLNGKTYKAKSGLLKAVRSNKDVRDALVELIRDREGTQ